MRTIGEPSIRQNGSASDGDHRFGQPKFGGQPANQTHEWKFDAMPNAGSATLSNALLKRCYANFGDAGTSLDPLPRTQSWKA